MANKYQECNQDIMKKPLYAVDIFGKKDIKRIKIDTKKVRVCEAGKYLNPTERNCWQTAYRQTIMRGKEIWICDDCARHWCEKNNHTIMNHQTVRALPR